jgi:phosphatidylinositol-4,5-bisphosphate 3-kinase
LPPNCEKITAKVKLPRVSGLPYSEEDPTHHTTVQLAQTGPLEASVGAAYEKIKHLKLGARTDFVFKASGLNDYLRGERNGFAYEYVRNRVRDQVEVVINLAKKPEPVPEPESVAKLLAAYNEQVDKTIPLMDERSFLQTLDEMIPDMPFDEIKHIPISEMAIPFRVKVCGVDAIDERALPRLSDDKVINLSLVVALFHGSMNLDQPQELTCVPFCVDPRWDKWCLNVSQVLLINNLPRESRIGFILKGQTVENVTVELGWAVQQLIDEKGALVTGTKHIRLWEFPAKDKGKHAKKEREDPEFLFRQSTRPNLVSKHAAILTVKFDEFARPVVAPYAEPYAKPNDMVVGKEVDPKTVRKEVTSALHALEKTDCLYALNAEEKKLLWQHRHSQVQVSALLPKFLQTVQWGLLDHKREAHRLLKMWAPQVSMVHLLELLEARYADYTVLKYAVDCLKRIKDDELQLYLLQFTQCLKYEPYHDSPLSRFLIERAIRSPYAVGHYFFWHLKAELHVPQFAERYGVILEDYLSHCGRYAGELRKQYNAVEKCKRVAAMIVRLKREEGYGDDAATKDYFKELHKLNREFFEPMGKFQIPLDPKWEATTLLVEKCRYMSSKMVPLWLVFNNADEDAPPIYIMFKSGDDLRQDILTLQMIRVMDKAWLLDGQDMKLRPYRCIATGVNERGDGVGMIEIVLNSDTTSGIQLKYGGGAMGALKLDPIDLFLRQHNKDKAYDAAVDNFICSCAGYCVATFVLGIGDRHNGNIMVTKDGHLFHIDFGHFLGNFKKKFGVNRERAAFVFTPEMAFVMGGKKYKKHPHFKRFLALCSRAYKVLRDEATILEILFVLMVSAGMPELMVEKDIHYLRDKLHLDETETRANTLLREEIDKSLTSNYRRFDNMIHNFKHG